MSTPRLILGGGLYDARQAVLRDAHGGLQDVVVLTIRDDAQNARQHLARRAVAALQHITHPNVETLLQTDTASPGQLVLRLPDGGDLRAYVAENPAADALAIARAIAQAVLYLHTSTPCVIHGNLDLSSILMRAHTPRLWDFALCRLDPAPATGPLAERAPQATGERDGMLVAAAPELRRAGRVTTASDVYAFGVLLFELFARHGPFASFPPLYAAALLYDGHRPSRSEIPPGPRGDALWAIIERCWAQDPAQRPDMRQVEADLRMVP